MRTRTLSAIATACILGLSACATPYQEMGLTGGVTATQLTASDPRPVGLKSLLSDLEIRQERSG